MKTSNINHSSQKGFTLVEILIVVIIVGLLAGIAVVRLGDSRDRASDSVQAAIASDINKAIQTAYIKGHSWAEPTTGTARTAVTELITSLANTPTPGAFTQSSRDQMIATLNAETSRGTWECIGCTGPNRLRDAEVRFVAP